ncbi:thioesterase family protein [candidate division KSB1 bacterium]|nr:thioesterase family protein [candidate division KSB1 bacterium]
MDEGQASADQLIGLVKNVFMEQIPFNKYLGMNIESLNMDGACIRIDMRPELVGNFMHGILHGGVISSVLDVMGGVTAFLSVLKKMEGIPDQQKLERLSRFGTIDLRIDFLRPGRGKYFKATGSVLRTGSKVAVTRMELHNDEELLIAVGTGTYVVV